MEPILSEDGEGFEHGFAESGEEGGGSSGGAAASSADSTSSSIVEGDDENALSDAVVGQNAPSEGGDNDGEEEEDEEEGSQSGEQRPRSRRSNHVESAFSSSSEEDDEGNAGDAGRGGKHQKRRRSSGKSQQSSSEWDRALRSGKPAAKFFVAPQEDEEDQQQAQQQGAGLSPSDVDKYQTINSMDSASSSAEQQHTRRQEVAEGMLSLNGPPPSSSTSNGHHRSAYPPPPPPPSSSSQQPQQQQQQPGSRSASPVTVATTASSVGSYQPLQQQHPPPRLPSSGSTRVSPNSKKTAVSSSSRPPHPPPESQSSSALVTAESSEDLSGGVLPDVLMNMRQKIESLTLFDSDMMKLAQSQMDEDEDDDMANRESLKRSSQQSISAAVLVSLAHKRYERRRLAAMEIEKVVRSLVQNGQIERIRAILLLLSDDYVRSTNEDARKGGVVALAACAIGLKKAHPSPAVNECRDLILASVVHACQDHSQRVRYYATESLFNVVKVIPSMAVQHFFILFEILRSLYADVDADVRSGAELLDKKLKEVIVSAMNAGTFKAEDCIPVFARFVYMRHKATKRLTLTWLQELNEKLIVSPILSFLHLFLGGIFDMVADPTPAIRESAILFLHSVLPKLLVVNGATTVSSAIEQSSTSSMSDSEDTAVDFDKILQSLVTTMEHPDPFVRKVAVYWTSRIVKAHMSGNDTEQEQTGSADAEDEGSSSSSPRKQDKGNKKSSQMQRGASVSVRNSLPHILPGILLR